MDEIKTMNFDFIQPLNVDVAEEPQFKLVERICIKHGPYQAKVFADGTELACPLCISENKTEKVKRELEREHKEIVERKEREETEEHIKYCKSLNVSSEFYFSNLEDYIPKSKGQEVAKKAVEEMIKTRTGKIILLGSNGAGKTMLASILCKTLKGRIYTMYEIATMIRQSYTAKAEKSELEIVQELTELPFLAIDELGRIANSEAVQNWFSFILDRRHTNGLPTMIIGNLHFKKDCEHKGCPKCFENYFDNDILSRLRENSTLIVLKCADERKQKQTFKYFSD